MDLPAFRRTVYRWACQLFVGLFIGGLTSYWQGCLSVDLHVVGVTLLVALYATRAAAVLSGEVGGVLQS